MEKGQIRYYDKNLPGAGKRGHRLKPFQYKFAKDLSKHCCAQSLPTSMQTAGKRGI